MFPLRNQYHMGPFFGRGAPCSFLRIRCFAGAGLGGRCHADRVIRMTENFLDSHQLRRVSVSDLAFEGAGEGDGDLWRAVSRPFDPALKRWAIFGCPSGTKEAFWRLPCRSCGLWRGFGFAGFLLDFGFFGFRACGVGGRFGFSGDMSIQSNQPNPQNQGQPGQTRQLNLQTMAEQFMAGVQRHFDMLAYNLASREAVTEEAYNAHAGATRVFPVATLHRNFEQMQAYSRDLATGQILNDSLNLAVHCLNNVHLFLALVKANKVNDGLSQEAQQKAQVSQQAFLQAPLDKKFNLLESDYGVICELEDTVMGLGFAMQALAQQGGIVKEAQLDDQKELALEFKVAKESVSSNDLRQQLGELEVARKVFREGEKVTFEDRELQSVLVTLAVFAHQLFQSVANYARDNQVG